VVFAQVSDTVQIAFVGDIFLGNWAEPFIKTHGYDYPLKDCIGILQEADLTVGNWECPITDSGTPFPKEFVLRASPGVEKSLSSSNIHALNLANNHILDYGVSGLKNTLSILGQAQIQHFGAGLNRGQACKEASFNLKGQKIAFLGFSTTFPQEFWATDTSAGTAFPYEELLRENIPRMAQNYDIVVISFHWSAELLEKPKEYQISLAHLCIDLGADLIIGHHPHIAQGVEVYKGAPIFYSLGNFAFASYSQNAKVGLIVEVDFKLGKAISAKITPVNVYNEQVHFQPVPLSNSAKSDFLSYLNSISQELNSKSIVITAKGEIVF
jgi:poly-gamma-glutamate synthesis protein (capsule biosynthesis protein)